MPAPTVVPPITGGLRFSVVASQLGNVSLGLLDVSMQLELRWIFPGILRRLFPQRFYIAKQRSGLGPACTTREALRQLLGAQGQTLCVVNDRGARRRLFGD